ncbi:MAG: ACT domain-containing protein [Actinomycetaceae bacterium]|nr:ACT domain-containing protein [Actinomycetaceae bacterium]
MTSTQSLDQLLATMDVKSQGVYVFVQLEEIPAGVDPFATVREFEGMTIVISERRALEAGLPVEKRFARITLDVPSSLDSVGVTATVAQILAARSITCNSLAGFHRDHLFVQVDKVDEAMEILSDLKEQAKGWLPQ